jgi:hypothetical protein
MINIYYSRNLKKKKMILKEQFIIVVHIKKIYKKLSIEVIFEKNLINKNYKYDINKIHIKLNFL